MSGRTTTGGIGGYRPSEAGPTEPPTWTKSPPSSQHDCLEIPMPPPLTDLSGDERKHLVAIIREQERQIEFWKDQCTTWMTLFAQVMKDYPK